jgi:multiple RNA-binding domain-containing protein 1
MSYTGFLPSDMASSRVFVKGLPLRFNEEQFKKHFSATAAVTDVKLFPQRKIGYVGYKTVSEAEKAVKYFNKSFIGQSRLNVGIAQPVSQL